MKKNDLIKIKGLDLKELRGKIKTLKMEIANLVLDKNMKKMKDLKAIFKKRKDLAQILTVIRQKQLLLQLEATNEKKIRDGQFHNVTKLQKGGRTELSK